MQVGVAVGPEMFREDAKRTMNLIVSQMQSENMAPDDAQVLDTSAYVNVCRRSIRLHSQRMQTKHTSAYVREYGPR